MGLGKRLKELREKAGYSQKDISEKLNVSRQAVSRWENEWSYPDIDSLVTLSKMYKISIDDLVGNADIENICIESKAETFNDTIEKIEHFLIVAVALLSCLVPVVGVVVSIGIFAYCYVKKINLKSICWIILVCCIIINISNTYIVLSVELPNWGNGNIEQLR